MQAPSPDTTWQVGTKAEASVEKFTPMSTDPVGHSTIPAVKRICQFAHVDERVQLDGEPVRVIAPPSAGKACADCQGENPHALICQASFVNICPKANRWNAVFSKHVTL
jgi:hypothetical protein